MIKILHLLIVTIKYSLSAMRAMKKKGEQEWYPFSFEWCGEINRIVGVDLEVSSDITLDENKSYVFAANHSSMMDIPAIVQSLKHNCNIMYKKELEKVPIWGKALVLAPYIAVDRSNPRNAKKSLEEAVRRLKDKQSLIIFPEGTRTENGEVW